MLHKKGKLKPTEYTLRGNFTQERKVGTYRVYIDWDMLHKKGSLIPTEYELKGSVTQDGKVEMLD